LLLAASILLFTVYIFLQQQGLSGEHSMVAVHCCQALKKNTAQKQKILLFPNLILRKTRPNSKKDCKFKATFT
jgi:hypothetical protein